MIRLLFVDDEPDIAEIAEMALSLDPEFRVRTLNRSPEALALIRAWRPDVVLLDVMMPGLTGPDVLAQLREYDDTRTLPVIFLTARAQSAELQNFATLDALGTIAKPFDPMALAAQIRALLP